MSVPTWRRDESKAEYLHQLYGLNQRLGQMTANLPKKYHWSYGSYLINNGLEALKLGQRINREYMNSINFEEVFLLRTELCNNILSILDNIGTSGYIYFEICKNDPVIKVSKRSKIEKWEAELGDKINNITKLIVGLKKYDHEKYNDYKSKQTKIQETKEAVE